MNMLFRYCPHCGTVLDKREEGGKLRMRCGECGFIQYLNPAPAAGILVRDDKGRVLLVRRKFEPFAGLWTMPAGFIEYGEEVSETAVRELEEETGLIIEIETIHTVESCRDDPRGDTVLVMYEGHVRGGKLEAGDDAGEVGFFPLDGLPEIAFACQRRVMERLIRNLS
ncbi:MAG: NUDIX hydrolase [Candidatus Krumholzibacteria bacterium]|nr:NUDIX hydrolase [Candidatus Krumholzibacteria bacterium]